jgi:hypothetical protein
VILHTVYTSARWRGQDGRGDCESIQCRVPLRDEAHHGGYCNLLIVAVREACRNPRVNVFLPFEYFHSLNAHHLLESQFVIRWGIPTLLHISTLVWVGWAPPTAYWKINLSLGG